MRLVKNCLPAKCRLYLPGFVCWRHLNGVDDLYNLPIGQSVLMLQKCAQGLKCFDGCRILFRQRVLHRFSDPGGLLLRQCILTLEE